jgi:sugar transferase EpsL
MIKKIFDYTFGLLFLVILVPAILFVALIIFINMGRPVIFKQLRPGLRGKPFYLYKFRTMNNTQGSDGELLPDDERLTALGKFLRKYSLDEIPQLVNVIRGELSFVGPRPLLMAYLERYNKEQARRLEVKPGITGWAQVNGRNAITWEDKFKLDVWYVDNRSFLLDLKIIWLTLVKVLKAEGISGEGLATMSEFKGSEGE